MEMKGKRKTHKQAASEPWRHKWGITAIFAESANIKVYTSWWEPERVVNQWWLKRHQTRGAAWLLTLDGNTPESLGFHLLHESRGSDWCLTGSDSLLLVSCLSKAIRKCSLWPENDSLWWHDIPFPWSTSIRLLWRAEWVMFQSQEAFISVGRNRLWKRFKCLEIARVGILHDDNHVKDSIQGWPATLWAEMAGLMVTLYK